MIPCDPAWTASFALGSVMIYDKPLPWTSEDDELDRHVVNVYGYDTTVRTTWDKSQRLSVAADEYSSGTIQFGRQEPKVTMWSNFGATGSCAQSAVQQDKV